MLLILMCEGNIETNNRESAHRWLHNRYDNKENGRVESLPSDPCKLHYTSVGTPVLTLFQRRKTWLCPLWTLCPVTGERRAAKEA